MAVLFFDNYSDKFSFSLKTEQHKKNIIDAYCNLKNLSIQQLISSINWAEENLSSTSSAEPILSQVISLYDITLTEQQQNAIFSESLKKHNHLFSFYMIKSFNDIDSHKISAFFDSYINMSEIINFNKDEVNKVLDNISILSKHFSDDTLTYKQKSSFVNITVMALLLAWEINPEINTQNIIDNIDFSYMDFNNNIKHFNSYIFPIFPDSTKLNPLIFSLFFSENSFYDITQKLNFTFPLEEKIADYFSSFEHVKGYKTLYQITTNMEKIDFLKKSDIKESLSNNKTFLHYLLPHSYKKGSIETINNYLNKGAKTHARDSQNKTALDILFSQDRNLLMNKILINLFQSDFLSKTPSYELKQDKKKFKDQPEYMFNLKIFEERLILNKNISNLNEYVEDKSIIKSSKRL